MGEENKSRFTADQLFEIEDGKEYGVDTSIYADERYLAIQMRQIKLGLLSGVDVQIYCNPEYDWFQMEEIRLGLESLVDVSVYADPNLTYIQMRQVRKGLEIGFDISPFLYFPAMVVREIRKALQSGVDILRYAHDEYAAQQLEQIRISLEEGVDVGPYLDRFYCPPSIEQISLGLKDNIDVSVYAKPEYNWRQMREIRLGLEKQLAIDKYSSPLYSYKQMEQIRLALEEGIPVDSFRKMRYSASDMERMRVELEEKLAQSTEVEEQNSVDYSSFEQIDELLEYGKERESTYHMMLGPDNMDAFLFIDSPLFALTEEEILKAAWDLGAHKGIQRAEMRRAAEPGCTDKMIRIATGQPPKAGVDGFYEYFFRTDIDGKPKVLPDGSVDYQNIEWFDTVKKGDVVAIYHPSEGGIDGFNVLGDMLPAYMGKDLPVLKGSGFHISEDGNSYISDFDGMISLLDGTLTIKNLLEVDEVTNATGNIFFSGTVHVKGNVGQGVVIRCMNDVMIDGFVEGATIRADGDIILKNGMNGDGKGVLNAGRNISGKFLEGVTAHAGEQIQLNSAINCNLSSEGTIAITKSNGSLIGGIATACKGMKLQNVGNNAGIRTMIQIGASEKMLKEYEEIKQQLGKIQEELRILMNAQGEYDRKIPPAKRAIHPVYVKLQNAIYTMQQEQTETMNRKFILDDQLDEITRSTIEVSGVVHEGTVVDLCGIKDKPFEARQVVFHRLFQEGRFVVSATSM